MGFNSESSEHFEMTDERTDARTVGRTDGQTGGRWIVHIVVSACRRYYLFLIFWCLMHLQKGKDWQQWWYPLCCCQVMLM